METFEGTTAQEADAEFAKRLRNPDVIKLQNDGDVPRVPCFVAPEINWTQTRATEKRVTATSTLECRGHVDAALAEIAEVGTGPGALSSALFGELADSLRPGVAVGSGVGAVVGSSFVPPTSAVIHPKAFEGSVPEFSQVEAASV